MRDREPEFSAVAEYLFSLKAHGPKFGIDRMRALAAELGHPERAMPCVHVAGTNGKGSVSAMLEAILRAAGWRTGLYTSPHLVHVGERVQVNRVRLTDAEIIRFVDELRPVGERIAAREPDLRPSFFELMTAMAFLQFQRKRCDVAVLETGLGGRLDATNIVAPDVTVITSIGLDHCELLGDTIEKIAAEKAGIIKPHVPVVLGRMPDSAAAVIRAVAARHDAPVHSVAARFAEGTTSLPHTSLEGEYQRWNAATAQLAAEALGLQWRLTPENIALGLRAVAWPGRWQRLVVGDRTVILDASHNPEGAAALDVNLARLAAGTGRAPVVVTGVLGLARAKPLLDVVARHAARVHLVIPREPRACGYDELESLLPAAFRHCVVRDTVDALFPDAGHCTAGEPGGVVVVTGSLYLLGEVMARLGL